MPHYVCTGTCGGVAPNPGICQTEGCPRHEHPLTECTCQDNRHEEVLSKESEEEE